MSREHEPPTGDAWLFASDASGEKREGERPADAIAPRIVPENVL